MRVRACAAIVVALAAASFACSKTTDASKKASTASSGPEATTIPQAAPMIAVLRAASASDAQGFRAAYSKRIRESDDQAEWSKNVREAGANLKKMYGDYKVEDFAFSFDGGADKGKLTVEHRDAKTIALAVVREDDGWKLDER